MYLGGSKKHAAFENNQDTYLFSSILRSAVSESDSNQEALPLFTISDSVIKSVETIVQNATQQFTNKNSDIIELQQKKIATGRKMHTLSFFSLLKSWKIVCPEADAYYETIAYNHVTLSWKFFLCIGHQSQWSEYFIECARQLPSHVLAVACKNILDLALDERRELYSYHILLQSIIWKFFILEDPAILTKEDNLEIHRFDFPFTASILESEPNDVQIDNASSTELLKVYEILLSKMFSYSESGSDNFDFVKLVFHAYKLTFQLLRQVQTCSGEFVKEIFRLNPLMEKCIHDCPYKKLKASASIEDLCSSQDPCNKLTSWKINVDYLCLLVCTYWEEVEQLINQEDNCLTEIIPLLPNAEDRIVLMENSFSVKTRCEDSNLEDVDLLKTIIQYQYPCGAKAAELILLYPEILVSNETLEILEHNIPVLCYSKNYVPMMNAIAEIEVKDARLRLLNLFYNVLSHGPVNVYNDVLKYMLKKWGYSEIFKLPDFNDQLIQFTRKTHTYEKAKRSLLPLFLQSPLIILQTVIHHALMQGSEGMGLIQVLKHLPVVCNEAEKEPLFSEVSKYFTSDSHPVEELKNMELLIETLMKVHIEEDIVSFDTFLTYCIIPTLSLANIKLEITLKCLNTALKVLNEKNAISVSNNVLMDYLKNCSALIHSCISSGSGKIKELVIQGLTLMYEPFITGHTLDAGTLDSLYSESEKWDPAVCVYMNKFFGQKTLEVLKTKPLVTCELLWTWCCFTADEELLKESIAQDKLSYEELISILVSVHTHFTMEEWAQSTYFIKEYCQHLHSSIVRSTLAWKLSESNFHLYATIRGLIDCLHFLLDQGTEVYFISCFTNTVMNLLNSQDVDPELLLYVFLDMCHLSSIVENDILALFSTFLIGIIKSIYSMLKDQAQKKRYKTLLSHAVRCLPDSEEKQSLLQKF